MDRQTKEKTVAELNESMGAAANAIVIDYKGISVPDVTELRRQVRDSNSNYLVVKNTLALLAIKDKPMEALSDQFSGPTAVAWSDDVVSLAKVLTKFAKEAPALEFKAVMLDGEVVPVEKIDQIAALPTREELLGKLAFLLNSPIQGLVNVLNANIKNLAVVLDQIAKSKSDTAAE